MHVRQRLLCLLIHTLRKRAGGKLREPRVAVMRVLLLAWLSTPSHCSPGDALRATLLDAEQSVDLLERSPTLKRGVQWKGPALTEVHLPSNCPRVEPTRFKDLLRKQPVRKRAAAELLAVQEGRLTKSMRGEGGAKRKFPCRRPPRGSPPRDK